MGLKEIGSSPSLAIILLTCLNQKAPSGTLYLPAGMARHPVTGGDGVHLKEWLPCTCNCFDVSLPPISSHCLKIHLGSFA